MKTKQIAFFSSALVLSAMLAACGGGASTSTPTPSVAATATSVVGTVQSWTRGEATAVLGASANVLASADLSASGTFTLTLPPADALSAVLAPVATDLAPEEGCQGRFSSSDPAARGYSFSTLDVTQSGNQVSQIVAATATITENTTKRVTLTVDGNEWVYVDRPTTLTGGTTCQGTSDGTAVKISLSANVKMQAGWNALKITGTFVATPTSSNIDLRLSGGTDGPSVWTDDSGDGALPLALSKANQAKELNLSAALNRIQLFHK